MRATLLVSTFINIVAKRACTAFKRLLIPTCCTSRQSDTWLAVADPIGRSLLLIYCCWFVSVSIYIQRKTQRINARKCVFPWHSQALQSVIGGWISGLAVVSKTCFGSPPGPLWIKCECSAVMQRRWKNGWMVEGKKERRKKRDNKRCRKDDGQKTIMRDFICSC